MRLFFDDASPGNALANFKLAAEFAKLKKERIAIEDQTDAKSRIRLLKIGVRIREITTLVGKRPASLPIVAAPIGEQDAPLGPRKPTSQFYEFDQDRKHSQRKKDNTAAMSLLNQIDTGKVDGANLTPDQKQALAKYSGTGGALIGADGKKGSAYEYYTPKPIAEGIWDLMGELGFSGGKVLDPCAGVGIFGATAPKSAAIDAVELNETSGRVNGLVNSGAGYTATISPFEKVAANTPDEIYDAVVTNVPFGGVKDRGGNQLHDNRYQNEPLQNYFILRSMEKLRPGGLAIFITPPRCVSGRGGKEEELRVSVSYMAEFMGAYRLPNSVFGTADADTMTDVIAFRKFSREMLDKIEELRAQSPQTLIDANVQWQPFIEGNYFKDEGRRFMLGEFVPKNPDDYRPIDRLISPASVPEIGKMLKKFPDSRIQWNLLDATETLPIIYRDGDTLTQSGQTLQMQDGAWVPLKRNEESIETAELVGHLTSPYAAFESVVSWPDAKRVVTYMEAMSQSLDIPAWLRGIMTQLIKLPSESERAAYWNTGVVGLSVAQVLKERLGESTGVNFIEEYKALSDAMQAVGAAAKNRPSALGGEVKTGLALLCNHYQKKTGFSGTWRGDVQDAAKMTAITEDGTFEGFRYETKSIWVPMDKVRSIYGDDFDPIIDANWCVSADGASVTRSDDYYVGNYAEFLKRIDAEIAVATDEDVLAKLLRQKFDAEKHIDKVDVTKLNFNLFSPHVTMEEKAEFLRRYVHASAAVVFDEATGEKRVDIDVPGSNLADRDKLLNRVGDYLKNGTITLGGIKLSMSDAEAIKELRRIINTANEQFNGWTKSNKAVMSRLDGIASDPDKLRFRQSDDESPMPIPGLNPAIQLHGYQNSFVRKQSREFGGINGFGVGLGKTFTAMAATQYAHSIGVKKKTFFVVPNSVLSNWRKEAKAIYVTTDDCLFIGLREKNNKATVSSSNFDADLTTVMENRHSKVFMSMEAFERIRMREETISKYEAFMRATDASFAETEDKKQDEKNKGKQATLMQLLSEKTGAAPYLEDLGVDSIVIDEGHMMKNGAATSDFKSAKYLSLGKPAIRAMDAQAKAWYIRGMSPLKDGVLLLTATPITNSPLEIYSMLSLAVGHERVNDMCLGIKGADNFMEMMCQKENIDDVTMDGIATTTDVFVGLDNVSVLRKAITDISTIKTAEGVGDQIFVPEEDERPTSVTLPDDVVEKLMQYKGAFRFAMDELSERDENRGDPDAFEAISEQTGEPLDLIGHPFNLINKMTMLIADPELDRRASFYLFDAAQLDKAEAVVKQFNAKKIIEKRPRSSPLTQADAVVSQTNKKNEVTGKMTTILNIEVRALIDGKRIAIDSIDPDAQSKFEAMAEKAGLDLDVTVPPKLAALLENFKKERANPRGIDDEGNVSPLVKQLIFCDILPLHNKIKMLLSKRLGISSGAIAIITGKSNNTPDEIMEVQVGFNGNGEDNKYQVVIANEKAEVGINLQKGTQAIHHLSIGFTPDSLTQRNGRGVRQGNKTAKVAIYTYDADGTFDSSKRTMVNKKADWIGSVMDVNGSDSIAVSGGMSKEQLESLIDVMGDKDAMARMQESIDAKEAEVRAESNRAKQVINISTIQKQNIFLAENPDAKDFAIKKVMALFKLVKQIRSIRLRIDDPKATASAVAKNEAAAAELTATANELRRAIAVSAVIRNQQGMVKSADEFIQAIASTTRLKDEDIPEFLMGKKYPSFQIDVTEDSQIFNDWESEVEMAKAMVAESAANFARQSQNGGGYSPEVVNAFVKNQGILHKGKPIVTGAFLRMEDGSLGVVDVASRKLIGINGNGTFTLLMGAALTGDLINPGADGYDAILTEAAQLEDALNASGTTDNTYSEVVPEVAQRRKTDVLTAYVVGDYMLPHPYYPLPIPPKDQTSDLKKHIAQSQQAIIKGFESSGYSLKFTVLSSIEIAKYDRNFNERDALKSYAVAHNLKLTIADLNGEYLVKGMIAAALSAPNFISAIKGDTEAEIRATMSAYMRDTMKWLDYGDVDPLSIGLLPWNALSPLRDAIYAVRPKEEIVAPPPAATPEAEAVAAKPNEIVGITGKTREWMGTIKMSAGIAGAGKYKWDGKALVWNVYRSTWDHIVASNPRAATDLRLTAGTRSYL